MSSPIYVVTPKDTPRSEFTIHKGGPLSPRMAVLATPDGNGPTDGYKQIDDLELGTISGSWETGLFSCFDSLVPNALMATCCPWMSVAQITSRLGVAPFNTVLLFFLLLELLEVALGLAIVTQFVQVAILGHTETVYYYHAHRVVETRLAVNPELVTVLLLAHATFCASLWALRNRIRLQFNIPGSKASDCVAVTCCPCFAVAQMATHIKSFTPGSCTFGPVDTLPCYQ